MRNKPQPDRMCHRKQRRIFRRWMRDDADGVQTFVKSAIGLIEAAIRRHSPTGDVSG